MNEQHDFLDEISDDPANRRLASSLRKWREDNVAASVEPDDRLRTMFSGEPPQRQPARWRQLLQRPAIAFGASFAAVLLIGVGALALVANSDDEPDVAAPTTSALSAPDATAAQIGDISLPADLSEQTSYATCVFDQLTAWFNAGFDSEATPQIIDECGNPPIPSLGPEAETFRQDLQAWANCAAGEVQALLPSLPDLIGGDDADIDPLATCGEPPDPRDYGLELPFLDFKNIDPSQFDFGPFNLDEFKLKFDEFKFEDLDIEELLGKIPPEWLPEGFDPENLDLEQLKELIDEHGFTEFEFKGCDPATGELKPLDLENFNFEEFMAGFDGCGFSFFGSGELEGLDFSMLFGQLENLDLEGLDLEGFDLEGLDLEGFDLEQLMTQLEGLDLDQLLADLFADEELDFGSFFKEFAEQDA